MSDKSKWGVLRCGPPQTSVRGLPTEVVYDGTGKFILYETKHDARKLMWRMRARARRRGWQSRYSLIELPDDNSGGTR